MKKINITADEEPQIELGAYMANLVKNKGAGKQIFEKYLNNTEEPKSTATIEQSASNIDVKDTDKNLQDKLLTPG